jgi:gliding motility-associated protein GldL
LTDNLSNEKRRTLLIAELYNECAAICSDSDFKSAIGLKKLDAMLKEAKIDGQLMESLGNSIKNFEAASKTIAPTAESLASTKKYSDELTLAATQMESINALYKIQLDSASKTTQLNEEVAENSVKLNQQMQSLTSNLSSLNNVYGGMLSAMSNK